MDVDTVDSFRTRLNVVASSDAAGLESNANNGGLSQVSIRNFVGKGIVSSQRDPTPAPAEVSGLV